MPTRAKAERGQGSRPRDTVGRRAFLAGLGGAVTAWPLAARAQQGRKKVLRVGRVVSPHRSLGFWGTVFVKRMAELGYVQGDNFIFETVMLAKWDRSAAAWARAVRELVARKVDIVFFPGPEIAIRAAAAAVDKTPLVIASPDFDPVAARLAKSYRKPGGTLTGVYSVQAELTPLRLQLLKQAIPGLKALTVFHDANSANQWRDAAAARLGLELFGVGFNKIPYDFERGYASVPAKYRHALLVPASPSFPIPERRRLPDFALRHRLPTMFVFRNYVAAGGLMSYGANLPAMAARAADYVDLIAKGANPGSLPIAQPPKFDFAVNLKTAKTLGIRLPRSILLRASEVIE